MHEREVAVPPDGASAKGVVRAYVDALDAHDCETADALLHPDVRDESAMPCVTGRDLDDFSIRSAFRERPSWTGHRRDQQVVHVTVRFGREWWGYLLVRDSRDDPWRIFDEGVG